jgi:hypothetical protein
LSIKLSFGIHQTLARVKPDRYRHPRQSQAKIVANESLRVTLDKPCISLWGSPSQKHF